MDKEKVLQQIIELFATLPDEDDEQAEMPIEGEMAPMVEETKAP
jgi:hypothetical protein